MGSFILDDLHGLMADYTYIGDELNIFSAAKHWKSYLRSQIKPYMGRNVLEIGAGLGGTTKFLCQGQFQSWICLEPDPTLANQLSEQIQAGQLPSCCQVQVGTLDGREPLGKYDTLLYIDVLEHIEHDAAELVAAAGQVAPGGYLVVLSPAHQWLFSEFDRSIGHYRRYTRAGLKSISPPGLNLVRNSYLDSVGLIASLANRFFLKSGMPTSRQVAIWDGLMVPASTFLDQLLFQRVGKSVLAVWQRPVL